MQKTVIINVVGLTPGLLGKATPRLSEFAKQGKLASIKPVLPAVTCSVQSTYLTGRYPGEHGIVGNGWYFADECEIKLWRQSNHLVQSPKVWETARELDSSFTCANMFWWYNMYSTVDYCVTPRPMYPADGRKLPDIYSYPLDMRPALQKELGQFPLFNFWGPNSSIKSSQWIADSSIWVDKRHDPTLTLIYLPHLDYCLQKFGPVPEKIEPYLREIDKVCGQLIDYYGSKARLVFLSEYGITNVSRPVHINRVLRQKGLISVREELGRELLDAGTCGAFAVADHQIAHIYVNDSSRLAEVKALVEQIPGVAQVLDAAGKKAAHIDHPRAGDLVALAERDAWFTYYYWLDDNRAPDFARAVDIHRKPGYDPAELFVDPQLKRPMVKIGLTLAKKQLGFRYLMDVIGLDASVVRGSHGLVTDNAEESPLFMTQESGLLPQTQLEAVEVYDLILKHCGFSLPTRPLEEVSLTN